MAMEYTLSQIFETATRDEMKALITCLAECVNEHLILNGAEEPLVIVINGSENAGKTLFWDTIRLALLPHGVLDQHNSKKTEDSLIGVNRDFETWEGFWEASQSYIRIFCANALDITDRIVSCLIGPPEFQKKLGEVILINNTNSSSIVRTAHLNPDVIINVSLTDQDLENWGRRTRINIPVESRLKTLTPLTKANIFCTP